MIDQSRLRRPERHEIFGQRIGEPEAYIPTRRAGFRIERLHIGRKAAEDRPGRRCPVEFLDNQAANEGFKSVGVGARDPRRGGALKT